MTDHYPGQDLLADVFEGTEDAPLPIGWPDDRSVAALWFWPHPGDTRWKPRPRPGRSER